MRPEAPDIAPPSGDESAAPTATTITELVVAWALVGIPLAWGVWQVFQKSLDLFR